MLNLVESIVKRFLLFEKVRIILEELLKFYMANSYPKNVKELSLGKIKKDNKLCIAACERNLIDMKNILDKIGVEFWLNYGTFLGAYRDGALILFDNDIDLALCIDDRLRISYFDDEFRKAGFKRVRWSFWGMRFYRNSTYVGVVFFRKKGNKMSYGFYEYDLDAFEVYNEVHFLGKSWRIFSNPEKWLRYIYGEDWQTPQKDKHAQAQPMGFALKGGKFK